MTKLAVLGGGSWGTSLADMLAGKGYDVALWIREPELVREIRIKGENTWFLPEVKLNSGLQVSDDPQEVMRDADYFLVAIPSQFMRQGLGQVKGLFPERPVVVCASKGIELSTLKPMSKVIEEILEDKDPCYASLSGPSFAREVSQGLPTAVSLGCADIELGRKLQDLISTDYFRVYANSDYKGVELGGALKNIIAIATGISDGLSFGHNARAALITRGLAEIARLGVVLGGEERTFMGLSGMGDLVLTCTGDLSRNRQVGLKLGQGQTLDQILSESRSVAEGVKTTESVRHLSLKIGVDMPITEQVFQVLFKGKDPGHGVKSLMTRGLKME